MHKNNIILPFTICDDYVRGRLVKLDFELDKIIKQNNYPEAINRILVEILLISAMLGSQFKEEIILSIQLQNNNYFKYIIADFQSPGNIRGYAQLHDDVDYNNKTYQELIKDTLLSVTIDLKMNKNQRYQGIINVEDDSLAKAMEKYFLQSEQIKTSVKLAFGNFTIPGKEKVFCGGGILIQQMPDDFNNQNWNEAKIYFDTLRDDELIDPELSNEQLLYSLYHEVKPKIFEKLPLINKCRCSRERAEKIITSLGKEEAFNCTINDKIEINCQFCNQNQVFTLNQIEKLFC